MNADGNDARNDIKPGDDVDNNAGNIKAKRRPIEDIFDLLEMFAESMVAVILLFTFVFRVVTVEGPSMEHTLHGDDVLIISNLLYTPKQNDIVVVQVPEWWSDTPIIKRVIAVEGQTVDFDFANWKVYVDGEEISEPYVNYEPDKEMAARDIYDMYGSLPLTVDEGKVFVMGDNRNHSADSRSRDIGQIDVGNVMGRVFVRVLPVNKFGTVKPAVSE